MGVYFIPVGLSFVDVLAEKLLSYGEVLPKVRVFLPSHRSQRSLSEALLRHHGGKPLLMPKLFPLGDADLELLIPEVLGEAALPPAVGETERQIRLALLIQKKAEAAEPVTAEDALRLANSFLTLADDFTREQVAPYVLNQLVPEDFAEHWQASLRLLSTVLEEWPLVLKEEGKTDKIARRNMEMALLAEHWRLHPPAEPVIAAGTTGSIPATAALLKVIADMPTGKVILPGLDAAMREEEWDRLSATHSQYGLKQLLSNCGYRREQAMPIGEDGNSPRTQFLRTVMTPASLTDDWQDISLNWEEALENITSITCSDEHEEAGVLTLLLRDVLEQPGKTAMLVTHDRILARHVATAMRRYSVTIDDSAGVPITSRVPFVFLKLIAEYICGDSGPVRLLALLKHPLLRMSLEPAVIRDAARQLEASQLRGVRTWNSWKELEEKVRHNEEVSDEARAVFFTLHAELEPLHGMCGAKRVLFSEMLGLHLSIAEALAAPEALTREHDGSKLMQCLNRISVVADSMGPILPQEYPAILTTLLARETYRQPYDNHPRIRILSPLEARLQQVDVVILAGMNEGSWPPEPAHDPWLSLPMREKAGLKSAAYQIGQSAHDFWILSHAKEVVITRARKQGGTPSIPCRWLLRMETVLEAAGEEMKAAFNARGEIWRGWYQQFCKTDSKAPVLRPSPTPPLAARPTRLGVTSIRTLMEDPYVIYASQILGIGVLEPLDQAPGNREFGIAVHYALQLFFKDYPALPVDAESILYNYLDRATWEYKRRHRAALFWEQRLQVIARHVVAFAQETESRRSGTESEQKVEMQIEGVTIHGRIDRKEIYRDGSVSVIDYKTGEAPREKDIEEGREPQLGLLGLIVARQGGRLRELAIWPLKGKDEVPSALKRHQEKISLLLSETESGITALLGDFMHPQTPYLSLADQHQYENPYDHLARVGEWA